MLKNIRESKTFDMAVLTVQITGTKKKERNGAFWGMATIRAKNAVGFCTNRCHTPNRSRRTSPFFDIREP
jgi:hypothetical protein